MWVQHSTIKGSGDQVTAQPLPKLGDHLVQLLSQDGTGVTYSELDGKKETDVLSGPSHEFFMTHREARRDEIEDGHPIEDGQSSANDSKPLRLPKRAAT